MAGLEKKVLEKIKFVGNVHQITKDWGSSKTAPERSMLYNEYMANKAELAKVVKAKLDGMMAGKDAPRAIDEIKGYFEDIVKSVLGMPDEIDNASAIKMQKGERFGNYGPADWSVMDAPSSEYKAQLMGVMLRNKVEHMVVREV